MPRRSGESSGDIPGSFHPRATEVAQRDGLQHVVTGPGPLRGWHPVPGARGTMGA